jgi:hypothetical protein
VPVCRRKLRATFPLSAAPPEIIIYSTLPSPSISVVREDDDNVVKFATVMYAVIADSI